jgi:glucose dehydrogenase
MAVRSRRCCACTTRERAPDRHLRSARGLHAGPISYKLAPDHKQFLVVAPGGHSGVGSPLGDAVIAYTLP